MIIAGCGGLGFLLAWNYNRELVSLRQLIRALQYMESELEYKLTPLAELCTNTAAELVGNVKAVYQAFAQELENQIAPDAAFCMNAALQNIPDIPRKTAEYLESLGQCLGKFDLEGQLRGLEAVRNDCAATVAQMESMRPQRVRNYQTLGLCAGAALAILFL